MRIMTINCMKKALIVMFSWLSLSTINDSTGNQYGRRKTKNARDDDTVAQVSLLCRSKILKNSTTFSQTFG